MRQILIVLLYNVLRNSCVLIKGLFFTTLSVGLSCTTDYCPTAYCASRDTNAGTSMNSAWATLEKVNSTDFLPGDKMLFEGR